MREQPKATGTRGQLVGPGVIGGSADDPPIEAPISLTEAGIDKNLAHQARAAARLSEDAFEQRIVEVREAVIAASLKRAKAVDKRQAREATEARITATEDRSAPRAPRRRSPPPHAPAAPTPRPAASRRP
jgi:hypothetical protein